MDPRQLELSPSLLSSLGLPEHVGRGNATIVRTNRTESLFDVLTKLRTDNTELRQRFADPLRRPTVPQLETGIVNGSLTDRNPLDRIALQRVAAELQDVAILPIPQAVQLYASTRQDLQDHLRQTCYPRLGGTRLADLSGQHRALIEQRLLRYLPVARVPNRTFHHSNILGNPGQQRWHNALLADSASISDDTFIAALESYYDVARRKEKLDARGTPLSAEDFTNLRACVGGQMGELLEFLVCKGFDDATRRAMGISDWRARASIARYDVVCSQLQPLRREAEEQVQSKEMGTTGAAPTNERAAVHRRMKRLADEMGLFLNDAQARVASAKRSVRDDPEVLRTLQAIVRNMGASFKSEDGFTPADAPCCQLMSKSCGAQRAVRASASTLYCRATSPTPAARAHLPRRSDSCIRPTSHAPNTATTATLSPSRSTLQRGRRKRFG